MKPEPGSALDFELQHLRRWLMLLEQWGDRLRHEPNAAGLAQSLCRLLVDGADYTHADLSMALADGSAVSASAVKMDAPARQRNFDFGIEWQGQLLGTLRLSADLESIERQDEHRFITRMVSDLAFAFCTRSTAVAAPHTQSRIELLAMAIEQSPFGIVVTDTAGHVEYCNPTFTAMSGYTLADISGAVPFQWNPAESSDAIYRSLLSTQHMGERWQSDALSRRKDGSVYWERQVASTLRDADGKSTHLIVVKEDISALKNQNQAAEQTLLLHEQALASSSNGIMITRSDENDHSIVYVNPAFERITGYSAAEVIGLEGRFLVRDDLAQPDLEKIRDALREKREGEAVAQLPQRRLAVLE